MQKTIVITGATGLIGGKIIEMLLNRGDKVIAVTRNAAKARSRLGSKCIIAEWDFASSSNEFLQIFLEANAVIHLAGENVLSKRWSPEHKKNIYNSRVLSTKSITDAIIKSGAKPKSFVSASAVGYYGISSPEPVDEYSKCGSDFLARLTQDWENASSALDDAGIRRVNIRTGIVLDRHEGALAKMIPGFKYFIGGPLGSGTQFFPWVHINDVAGLFVHAIDNSRMSGAYNAAAPDTITMNEFCRLLGHRMKRPSFLHVPSFALKILYGEGANILLGGVNVIPKRSLESGYKFSFTGLKEALENLL
jgi:uncharacterized protein (TIGR01777 family)